MLLSGSCDNHGYRFWTGTTPNSNSKSHAPIVLLTMILRYLRSRREPNTADKIIKTGNEALDPFTAA